MDTIKEHAKVMDFLIILNRLTEVTGVVVTTFGDEFYNPRLTGEEIDPDKFYFISYNEDIRAYEIRVGNPYDGKLLRKDGFVVEEEKEVD